MNGHCVPVEIRADTRFRVGDQYRYRSFNRIPRGDTRESVQNVTAITSDEVIFSDGVYICDLLGNTRRRPNGVRLTALQELPLEYQVGKRWSTRFEAIGGRGEGMVYMDYRITAREKITVPAGTFDCFRIEGQGVNRQPGKPDLDLFTTQWRAPELVRRPIAGEEIRRRVIKGHVTTQHAHRNELVSFKQT